MGGKDDRNDEGGEGVRKMSAIFVILVFSFNVCHGRACLSSSVTINRQQRLRLAVIVVSSRSHQTECIYRSPQLQHDS